MPDFTPDEMAEFGREAIKPYLKLDSFMKRENWNRSTGTNCYVRSLESADMNWVLGLLCLTFRTGVVVIKAELWECYEGEGKAGLDERWDIGTSIMAEGLNQNEHILVDLFTYVAESERELNEQPNFESKNRILQMWFNRLVKKHDKLVPEPQEEAARVAVQAMIEAASI